MKKYKVAVIGATGMVGQRFLCLLQNHPMFEVACLAASPKNKGKSYKDAALWRVPAPMPEKYADITLFDAEADAETIAKSVDFCFCAVNLDKEKTKELEYKYAKLECPVISNNSAHRLTPDVPMVIPEINSSHLDIIPSQRKRLATKRGFIAVKSNCSLQSYVPLLHPLMKFGIKEVAVCTYQAISGAGKTFESFPEIVDNVIPFIGGEEEKSETEPMKIWGHIEGDEIVPAKDIKISAQCLRVPVSDGHMAAVFVNFENKPTKEEIISSWESFKGLDKSVCPSAPVKFIRYTDDEMRPQPKLDRDTDGGMAITCGRLREDNLFDYKFIGCSHNTLRGAAGGAVLLAETLAFKGYLD